jgi:hypothetical protein
MELEFAIAAPHPAKLEAFHARHARLELVSPEIAHVVGNALFKGVHSL